MSVLGSYKLQYEDWKPGVRAIRPIKKSISVEKPWEVIMENYYASAVALSFGSMITGWSLARHHYAIAALTLLLTINFTNFLYKLGQSLDRKPKARK